MASEPRGMLPATAGAATGWTSPSAPVYAQPRIEHLPVTKQMMTRHSLTEEVLGELAAHQPAKALRYMRKMPGGALSLVHLQVLTALETEGPLAMRQLA